MPCEGLPSEARSTRSTGDQPRRCLHHLGQDVATHPPAPHHPIKRGAGPGLAQGGERHAVRFFEGPNSSLNSTLRYSLPERIVHPLRHVLEVLHQQTFTGAADRAVGPEHGEVFSIMSNWACFRATSNRRPSTRSWAVGPRPTRQGHRLLLLHPPQRGTCSSGMTVTSDASIGKTAGETCARPASALQVTTAASRTRPLARPPGPARRSSRPRETGRKRGERKNDVAWTRKVIRPNQGTQMTVSTNGE